MEQLRAILNFASETNPTLRSAQHDEIVRHSDHWEKSGQAMKGARGMPWRQQAMKDVASCDKLREDAKLSAIRRFPNRETDPGWSPDVGH